MTLAPTSRRAPARPQRFQFARDRARLLDFTERALVALLYLAFVASFISAYHRTGNVAELLILPSEALVFVFTLLRRPANTISVRPLDWLLGFGGTALPLAIRPGAETIAPIGLCAGLILAGLLIQIAAKLVLNRSFGIVAANRGVRSSGPYRIVRHPIYAGYFVSNVGVLLVNASLVNALLYLLAWSFQIARIVQEERVLGEDGAYRAFKAKVRYRVIPLVF